VARKWKISSNANPTYEQIYDSEWSDIPKNEYHIACCDCGPVHRRDVRMRKGHLQHRVFVLRRETGQIRRWNKIKVVRPNR